MGRKLFQKKTENEHILQSLIRSCCKNDCIRSISFFQIKQLREKIYSMNRNEKLNYVSQMVQLFLGPKKVKYQHWKCIFAGHDLCRIAMIRVLGISNTLWYKATARVSSSIPLDTTHAARFTKRAFKTDQCVRYLTTYRQRYADKSPKYDLYYLPCQCQKQDLYFDFIENLKDADRTFY